MDSNAPLAVIFMDSKSDLKHCEEIACELSKLGVRSQSRVCSGHKAPARLLELISRYEAMTMPKVYITVSARSNGLSGMADAGATTPVLACPVQSSSFAGADLLSSIRMVDGVAPMFVMDTKNCALAAAKIFGVYDAVVRARVKRQQSLNRSKLHIDDCELKSQGYKELISAAHCFIKTDLTLKPVPPATQTIKSVGKVRDRYDDGAHAILITTDRLTAFDRPIAMIPFKGQVLNLVSRWWFAQTADILPNHIADGSGVHPNVTLGKSCKPFPIEFVVRGYVAGSSGTSMLKNYQKGVRNFCGIELPDGLTPNQKLWTNLVTPTTKECVDGAHDENISPAEIVSRGYMTQADWDYCSGKALEIFARGQKIAAEHGLILVDTKYEMGKDLKTGEILLIDEIHTPDSSRYWLASSYDADFAAGRSPTSIDKDFVRKWFVENCDPYVDEVLPIAPVELINELSRRYIMLYEIITGEDFPFSVATGDAVNAAVQRALDAAKV